MAEDHHGMILAMQHGPEEAVRVTRRLIDQWLDYYSRRALVPPAAQAAREN
jgi:hypothetical protein